MTLGDWIREAIKKKRKLGITQRRLAEHIGVHESVMSRILSGERELTVSELSQISSFLGESPPQFNVRSGVEEQKVSLQAPRFVQRIPVTTIIASGVWREKGALVLDRTVVPASPDPRLSEMPQYSCRIDGPEYRDVAGQYAVCVPYHAMRSAPTEPDVVHVVRRRGDLEEHSLRSVSVKNKTTELVPLSDVDQTIALAADSDVEIAGLVVGFFKPTSY